MVATNKTFLNNSAPQCEDADLNGFNLENKNLIEGSGQTASDADRQQTHKAVAVYASGGSFYSDSGAANAYVLSTIGSKIAPPALFDGMEVVFLPGNTNTGASTANVASTGVKSIYWKGAALTGGELPAGYKAVLRYSLSNDRYDLRYSEGVTVDTVSAQNVGGAKTFTSNITLAKAVPSVNIKDTGGVGTAARGSLVWQDAVGAQLSYVGPDNASSADLYIGNNYSGADILMQTSGGTAKIDGYELWHAGNLAAGTLGAHVHDSAGQIISPSTVTALTWDSEVEDTSSIHDLVTNTSRLTVPAGVTRVRLHAFISWNSVTANTIRSSYIRKNGTDFYGGGRVVGFIQNTGSGVDYCLSTAILTVSGGDYFEVYAFHTASVSATVNGISGSGGASSWFSMEIIK